MCVRVLWLCWISCGGGNGGGGGALPFGDDDCGIVLIMSVGGMVGLFCISFRNGSCERFLLRLYRVMSCGNKEVGALAVETFDCYP